MKKRMFTYNMHKYLTLSFENLKYFLYILSELLIVAKNTVRKAAHTTTKLLSHKKISNFFCCTKTHLHGTSLVVVTCVKEVRQLRTKVKDTGNLA